MARKSQILVETTKPQKDALANLLREQGSSLTEWFNDNAAALTLGFDAGCVKDELADLRELADTESVFDKLSQLDWGFQDEDTGYLSHDIHPYPAKFIPQIPRNLIANLSLRGETVWDPFGGSGTTALESVLLGRQAISSDVNPLAEIIGRAKLLTLTKEEDETLRELREAIQIIASDKLSLESALSGYEQELFKFIPTIPNMEEWFHPQSIRELGYLRSRIVNLPSPSTISLANVCFSKIILKASFQDAETRYVRTERDFPPGKVLNMYGSTLDSVLKKVRALGTLIKFRTALFKTADLRLENVCHDNSVDLIIGSPPYPNATDYHLYHRFRLFWLGFDPRELGHKEIGSHLRHQKEDNGIEHYLNEMTLCLKRMFSALRPGRFAVLIIGDGLFKGKTHPTAEMVASCAASVGFTCMGHIGRTLPKNKRSFAPQARRLREERLVVLCKPSATVKIHMIPPPYRLWPYERKIRVHEIEHLLGVMPKEGEGDVLTANVNSLDIDRLRRLTFSHGFSASNINREATWQAILENGDANTSDARKNPKYATHGLHPYKGKFYPQLARSLFNLGELVPGQRLLDPFCGSGTVPLEAFLNGLEGIGFDMNPLAVKIGKAKTEVLLVDPYLRDRLLYQFQKLVASMRPVEPDWTIFPSSAKSEIESWFPNKVIGKIVVLLKAIRQVPEVRIREWLEVLLSSIVRDISQQDPEDLRIRRRSEPLKDAPVFELLGARLNDQRERLSSFSNRSNRSPYKFVESHIFCADSRVKEGFTANGVTMGSIDGIVTSPPYATALPYIDTDRLSLLVLCGIGSSERSEIEEALTGSREIRTTRRKTIESEIEANVFDCIQSPTATAIVKKVYTLNRNADVGFRRKNMASLLYRYFADMSKVMRNIDHVLKPGGSAFFVIGDTLTTAGGEEVVIKSSKFIQEVGIQLRWSIEKILPITVTQEKRPHSKNSITDNDVLWFKKPR